MQAIPANQLLAGLFPAGRELISNVTTDSRKLTPGCVFVCFAGRHFDGHDFAAKALRQGAAYVVAEHPVEGLPADRTVLCPSSHRAMVRMASNYRTLFSAKLVGVTGSVGKTTTKEFCYAALSAFGETIKTEGNQNNEIGLPNTLFRLAETTEYGVVEMGMSALGEIERLSRAARPAAGIITGIGVAHLEQLGSRENILRAKLELCAGLPDGASLVLKADDEYLPCASLPSRLRPVWFGIDSPLVQVRAANIRPDEAGQTFTIEDEAYGSFEAYIPAIGRHNIYDALAAYTAVTRLGLDPARAAAALADYQTTGLRQHIVHHHGVTVIEDCYNANPDSMRAALEMFAEFPARRRFVLMGDMLSLGSITEQAHEEAGALAARCGMDYLIAYGPAARRAAVTAAAKGIKAMHFETPEDAAEALSTRLAPGDALLAKGSRDMALENILKLYYDGEAGES